MLKRRSNLASDSCFSSNSMEKIRSSTFFNVPGLFVGFTGKGVHDSDPAKSPTSPLDHRLFSNFSSSFVRSPRSMGRSWDCSRVGLGLVDSLSDEKGQCSPESKNILLGPQMRIVNKITPKPTNLGSNMATSLFSPFGSYEKIESCTADKAQQIYHNPKPSSDVFVSDSKSSNLCSPPNFFSGSLPMSSSSINGFMGSLSASEIELSEDYTCIISHGPNPKTTHIFGDCILENFLIESMGSKNKQEEEEGDSHWIVKSLEETPPSFHSNDFLSFCCHCNKKLEVGKDIYMYRGEKAFCSYSCREQEILFDEELEGEKEATGMGPYDSPSSSSPPSMKIYSFERMVIARP
ncbi:uncharacterized protein LOC110026060 [Phalaenopsis equestris]|uniref:uncharacterized protein LOC110026060 n=1 Tax=Phalaenopsis equestris TaxID=78828 RepID=UPI0009E2CC6A|nr:uncharacterized protein LOC110026060 [Phalaenopsis equestris]XP_020582495.1 uncharacterized protein LOC110026060 [Phalaenopsis equestris]